MNKIYEMNTSQKPGISCLIADDYEIDPGSL